MVEQQETTSGPASFWSRWRPRLAELLVIVISILLAFQVEEWREERAEQRDLRAVLERLMEETGANLELCAFWDPVLQENARSVAHVFQSLEAGALVDGDSDRFEQGLIEFGVVPDIRMHTTVSGEMLATGLLKELDDSALRSAIARLPALELQSRDLLTYWRAVIVELNSEVMSTVDFSYGGDAIDFEADTGFGSSTEKRMSVRWDLAEMAANRRLRNLFFEAVDVHTDLWSDLYQRCRLIQETRDHLAVVIEQ